LSEADEGSLRFLSFDEWGQLSGLEKNERDQLIVELLYETGCTVNELVNIKKSDIILNMNQLKFSPKHTRNKEPRIVYISSRLVKKIKKFCQQNPESDHLLSSRQSSTMTTKRIRQIVQGWCGKLGKKNAGPQILRYTHIVHAYLKNIPLNAIQKQVGLKRSRAIEIFSQLPESETKGAYRNFVN